MSEKNLTVSEYNLIVKNILESEILLQDIWISGEISQLRHYAGKMTYFTLIDAHSQLSCVMFKTTLDRLNFTPKEGDAVIVRGSTKTFQKKGTLQFQVSFMVQKGVGAAQQNLEKIKLKLLKEGLFDDQAKKPIPKYGSHITLVTANNSAALSDFLSIKKQYAPHLRITLIPAIMQGDASPPSVIDALHKADHLDSDAVVLMRGGGSVEDLGGFNNESLVRAIFSMKTPIISAIGHEIDYTLSDFAADYRASTPTAAAEYLVKPFVYFLQSLGTQLVWAKESLEERSIEAERQCHTQVLKAKQLIRSKADITCEKVTQLLSRAESLNPLKKLRQGFSITRDQRTQTVLKSISSVKVNQALSIELVDGRFQCEVKSIHHG